PDAKVVSGIDFDRVKGTPFGQFVLSQLPPGDSSFREFVAVTGFDPLQDIHEVLMASPADAQKKSGLLLVRGRFDGERIVTLFKAEGKTAEMYRGVSILSSGHNGHGIAHALAFLDGSTVAAGDAESVRSAIDRRSSFSGIEPALADKITRISANRDAWVF